MPPIRIQPVLLVFTALLFSGGLPATAQDSAPPAPPALLREAPQTVEGLEKAVEQITGDTSIAEAEKEALLKRYDVAISDLAAALEFEARVASLTDGVEASASQTAAIRAELERRRTGQVPAEAAEESDPSEDAGVEALSSSLSLARSRVAEMTRQLRQVEGEVAQLEARPDANRRRLVELSAILSEAESAFGKWIATPPTKPADRAQMAQDQAAIRKFRSEVQLLQGETPAFEPHRQFLAARRELLASDLALAREKVARLERRSDAIVSARIGEAERLLRDLGEEAIGDEPGLRSLIQGTRDLAQRNQKLLGRLSAAEAEFEQALETFAVLRRDSESIRAQIEIGGLEGAFSEIMLELRSTLPTRQGLRSSISERRQAINEARLEAFRTEREFDSIASPEGQAEEALDVLRRRGADEETLGALRSSLVGIAANRIQLANDYAEGNRRLAERLGEIEQLTQEMLFAAVSLREFLGERLVWVASSPPLGKNAFTGLRSALLRIGGGDALADYAATAGGIDPARWALAALLAVVLLLPRRRLRRLLAESAARTRRISRDGIGNTIGAIAISIWLALPMPVLLAFFGWTFASESGSTDAAYALGLGLLVPAPLLLVLRLSSVLCWPGGVAEAHFGWKRGLLVPLHRALLGLIFLYLPAHLLIAVWWNDSKDLSAFQGPGRLVFIAAMLAMAFVIRRYTRGRGGVFPKSAAPPGWKRKLLGFWDVFFLLVPVLLAALAALGYFLAAVALANLIQKTGFVVFGAVLAYSLLTRWVGLRQRRMALAEAIAEREARRAAREERLELHEEPVQEESIAPTEEEEPLDWAVVGEQTRHLIRAFVVLSGLVGCWFAWSEALPALNYLDGLRLVGNLSVGGLVWLGLVAAVTTVVFQNLPGLLELGFLRALEIESGVRNAIVTLCQYLVVAVGAFVASKMIGLDWTSLSWIAAALSVGLGFGLQEVVANFVSGLILLFERPIRIGDIVTVGGVDGVVTRIRIRATTITNWDKKEFIVPNKEFVTGTIMNWTLSSSVNRLVFPVGIAYGTDTEKARSILLAIAEEQPEVLAEPAPLAVFEGFGDSALNFTLRCFLGSTDKRLELTHRINTLIHERFAEAGIGIPFPQREIHIASSPEKGA